MKKVILAIILTSASCVLAASFKPANYAGKWSLDKAQSKNLPKYYENIKSHKLSIAQDEKQMSIAVEIDNSQPQPDKMNFTYELDGEESKVDVKIRTQNGLVDVPATLKAVSTEHGNLRITIDRQIPMPDGGTFRGITIEDWKLGEDGKTLTIIREDETPRGKMRAEMVFVKN